MLANLLVHRRAKVVVVKTYSNLLASTLHGQRMNC